MKSSSETMRQLSAALLNDALKTWATVFRMRLDEKVIEKWEELFVDEDPRILQLALSKVTRGAERTPTFGALTKAVSAARDDLYVELRPPVSMCAGKSCYCQDPEVRTLNAKILAAVKGLTVVTDMKNARHKQYLEAEFADVVKDMVPQKPFQATDDDLPDLLR